MGAIDGVVLLRQLGHRLAPVVVVGVLVEVGPVGVASAGGGIENPGLGGFQFLQEARLTKRIEWLRRSERDLRDLRFRR